MPDKFHQLMSKMSLPQQNALTSTVVGVGAFAVSQLVLKKLTGPKHFYITNEMLEHLVTDGGPIRFHEPNGIFKLTFEG